MSGRLTQDLFYAPVGGRERRRAARTGFFEPLSRKSNYWRFSCAHYLERLGAELPAGLLVLDVGCGAGEYRGFFSMQRYVGLDLNPGFPGLDCAGDANNLPVQNDAVDIVIASNALEHNHSPEQMLEEAFRVLRRGGRCVVLVPFMAGLHQEPWDFYRYTKYGLRHLAPTVGFDVETLQSVGGLLAVQGQIMPSVVRRVFDRISVRPGGRAAVRVLRPLWALSYHYVILPLLHRLDESETSDADTLGYVAVLRKPSSCQSSVGPL